MPLCSKHLLTRTKTSKNLFLCSFNWGDPLMMKLVIPSLSSTFLLILVTLPCFDFNSLLLSILFPKITQNSSGRDANINIKKTHVNCALPTIELFIIMHSENYLLGCIFALRCNVISSMNLFPQLLSSSSSSSFQTRTASIRSVKEKKSLEACATIPDKSRARSTTRVAKVRFTLSRGAWFCLSLPKQQLKNYHENCLFCQL